MAHQGKPSPQGPESVPANPPGRSVDQSQHDFELGFFGGTLFTGAFYLAASGLRRKCPDVGSDGGELGGIGPLVRGRSGFGVAVIFAKVFSQVWPHCCPLMRFFVQEARVSLKPLNTEPKV